MKPLFAEITTNEEVHVSGGKRIAARGRIKLIGLTLIQGNFNFSPAISITIGSGSYLSSFAYTYTNQSNSVSVG